MIKIKGSRTHGNTALLIVLTTLETHMGVIEAIITDKWWYSAFKLTFFLGYGLYAYRLREDTTGPVGSSQ